MTATVDGTAGPLDQSQVLSSLNGQLNQYGISAQVGADGQINFGGANAFTVNTTTADATDEIATTALPTTTPVCTPMTVRHPTPARLKL